MLNRLRTVQLGQMSLFREFYLFDASTIVANRNVASREVCFNDNRPGFSVQGISNQPFNDVFWRSDFAGCRDFCADVVWKKAYPKGGFSHHELLGIGCGAVVSRSADK